MRLLFTFFMIGLPQLLLHAQQPASDKSSPAPVIRTSVFDGISVAGYVDRGAFLNFTGPNISLVVKNTRLILGMLPSLRFKEDNAEPHNSLVTPNLGAGLTFCYKLFCLQVPFYYNAKTATRNGSWHAGLGVGIRWNELNKIKTRKA